MRPDAMVLIVLRTWRLPAGATCGARARPSEGGALVPGRGARPPPPGPGADGDGLGRVGRWGRPSRRGRRGEHGHEHGRREDVLARKYAAISSKPRAAESTSSRPELPVAPGRRRGRRACLGRGLPHAPGRGQKRRSGRARRGAPRGRGDGRPNSKLEDRTGGAPPHSLRPHRYGQAARARPPSEPRRGRGLPRMVRHHGLRRMVKNALRAARGTWRWWIRRRHAAARRVRLLEAMGIDLVLDVGRTWASPARAADRAVRRPDRLVEPFARRTRWEGDRAPTGTGRRAPGPGIVAGTATIHVTAHLASSSFLAERAAGRASAP